MVLFFLLVGDGVDGVAGFLGREACKCACCFAFFCYPDHFLLLVSLLFFHFSASSFSIIVNGWEEI